MWLVKNKLKATLTLRGLDVSIPAGGEFDLDALGRDKAESSNQVVVALEEGYLENVFKAAAADRGGGGDGDGDRSWQAPTGMSVEQFDERMREFQRQLISEVRSAIPQLPPEAVLDGSQLREVRELIAKDVQEIVGEMKTLRTRFESMKGRVRHDPTLSEPEVKARLAFLEEKERELMKNFESVGRQEETDDGDVMDKADMLANL